MRCVVESQSGDGPALVYVPGIDGTGRLLLGQEPVLAESFHVCCLAYRGTAKEPGGATYEALAASVWQALAESGLEGPVLLLAESFGGAVALHAAMLAPDRVRALILVNSFAHYSKRWSLRLGRWLLPFIPAAWYAFGRRRFGPRAMFGKLRDPDVKRRFQEFRSGGVPEGMQARLAMIAGLDLRPRLAEITSPVLLVVSERDRVVAARRAAAEMAAGLTRVSVRHIRNAGHIVLPFPLPWCRWFAEFLDEQESRPPPDPV